MSGPYRTASMPTNGQEAVVKHASELIMSAAMTLAQQNLTGSAELVCGAAFMTELLHNIGPAAKLVNYNAAVALELFTPLGIMPVRYDTTLLPNSAYIAVGQCCFTLLS